MAGRSSKNSNRGSDLFGYFVSGKYKEFHTNQYAGIPPESGLTATGGVISDYSDSGTVYRTHIFTSSGTFNVTAPGTYGDTVEYLLVAGGGGGGFSPLHYGGGGGAGGLLSNHPDVPDSNPIGAIRQPSYTVSVGPYTVQIGAGGGAAVPGSVNGGVEGGNTNFYPTPVSYPSPTYLRAVGGGGGGARPAVSGDPGGSGGGAGESTPSPGYGTGTTNQGTPGGYIGDGQFGPTSNGHGGGGALTAGNTKAVCAGGDGLQVRISGSPTSEQPAGAPGPSPLNGYFAGGGAGAKNNPAAAGGFGGGGAGGAYNTGTGGEFGTQSTGGGGGGGVVNDRAGGGGSGIAVVRYKIAELTAGAKATGGAVSFYNNHAIHTFTGSGTFENTSGSDITGVTYVCIGGGGAGGGAAAATNGQNAGGGGGGAGGYVTASGQTISTTPFPVSIGAGGSRVGGFELPAKPGSNTVAAFPGGTVTAGYGGGGGYANQGASGDAPLGSGGGSAGEAGDPGSSGPQGNNGGNSGSVHAGGGGGAGGAGSPTAGPGGAGVQLPTVFQDPRQAPTQNIGSGGLGAPGPGGTKFWVAGGGGGGNYGSGTDGGTGGNAPQGDIRYAGAGSANYGMNPNYSPVDYNNAIANTGSGGGGISPHFSGGPQTNTDGTGGGGGSGLVLIAYPIA